MARKILWNNNSSKQIFAIKRQSRSSSLVHEPSYFCTTRGSIRSRDCKENRFFFHLLFSKSPDAKIYDCPFLNEIIVHMHTECKCCICSCLWLIIFHKPLPTNIEIMASVYVSNERGLSTRFCLWNVIIEIWWNLWILETDFCIILISFQW